jgi:hypothetical protein
VAKLSVNGKSHSTVIGPASRGSQAKANVQKTIVDLVWVYRTVDLEQVLFMVNGVLGRPLE